MPRRAQEDRRLGRDASEALWERGMGAGEGNRRDERLLPSGCELLVRAVLAAVGCAGQGAHREVGSEGFEANCRAVAEFTANRSARSRRYRACTMEAKEVLGEPGRNKVCAGGTAGKQHALPREISYGLGLTGLGTWAYKPQGEVVGDAVREVGVAHGTQEPGKSKSPGIVPLWGGGMATQTAPSRGKGSRWTGRSPRGIG